MGISTARLFGSALVAILTPYFHVGAQPMDQKAATEDTRKAEESVKKQFPVVTKPGVPPLLPLADDPLSHAFPQHKFFALILRQYPVARVAPEPLGSQNLFAVDKDGKVRHLKDVKGLEEFFRSTLAPVTDGESAKEDVDAWLSLTQQFRQDGFFKFSIPKDSLVAEKLKGSWSASGKAIITQGGKGEIRTTLTFTEAGRLVRIEETSNVKAGIRPICQATKLLDPDPVVRQMAEKDILVMGEAAKEYLDEQRAKAPPELKQAIDCVWQRIVKEGW